MILVSTPDSDGNNNNNMILVSTPDSDGSKIKNIMILVSTPDSDGNNYMILVSINNINMQRQQHHIVKSSTT